MTILPLTLKIYKYEANFLFCWIFENLTLKRERGHGFEEKKKSLSLNARIQSGREIEKLGNRRLCLTKKK